MTIPPVFTAAEFDLPDEWQDRRVILYFGGVESAFYVWVNGRKVGFSKIRACRRV